jgi:hypothetical protein
MGSIDLLAEYEEVKKLPVPTAVGYKFFSGFKVEGDSLVWSGFRTPLSEEVRKPVKAFLKEQRRAIQEDCLKQAECSRRIWFWYQKILDLGLFSGAAYQARAEILRWVEVCEFILS